MKTTSRKEQILQAAFELSRCNYSWSLSGLAAHIGVSKTALYRHFKNKDELLAAMDAIIVERLVSSIEDAEPEPEAVRISVTRLLRSDNGILFRLLQNFGMRPGYEHLLFEQLAAQSPRVRALRDSIIASPNSKGLSVALVKNCVSILLAGVQLPASSCGRQTDSLAAAGVDSGDAFHTNLAGYQDELISILGSGLFPLPVPSSARLDELEALCTVGTTELGPSNRLFDAIASTVHEFGMENTTIGRIADKMGRAKSSLYFYFPNKDEMLLELVKTEIDRITSLCSERIFRGNTLPEQLFILLSVQSGYLLLKSDILAVFNWIRYELVRDPSRDPSRTAVHPFEKPKLNGHWRFAEWFGTVPDLEARSKAMIKWCSILATTGVLHSLANGADSAETKRTIRRMFLSMLRGDRYTGELA